MIWEDVMDLVWHIIICEKCKLATNFKKFMTVVLFIGQGLLQLAEHLIAFLHCHTYLLSAPVKHQVCYKKTLNSFPRKIQKILTLSQKRYFPFFLILLPKRELCYFCSLYGTKFKEKIGVFIGIDYRLYEQILLKDHIQIHWS